MKTYTDVFPETDEFFEILDAALTRNGVSELVSREAREKLYDYALLLRSENLKYNLTAVTDAEGIASLHFTDSILLAKSVGPTGTMLDIGSGAGFPAVPMAVIFPELRITALDATGKKTEFIRMVGQKLGLNNLSVVNSRAEEYTASAGRERFDYVTARAVAPLGILTELGAPALKLSGRFVAMKAGNYRAELPARREERKVGCEIADVIDYDLALSSENAARVQIVMKKTASTPSAYPRAYAAIKKNPIF